MFKVKDIIEVCHAKLLQGDINLSCNSFCNDTRCIKKDDVYVAIKGEVFDGNDFYINAFENGANVCLLEKEVEIPNLYKDKTVLVVENTILAIQQLARYKISHFKGKVIAITGSVGKTSTKDMIYSVISTEYNTLRNIGNKNNHIGLPLTILSHTDEEVMVLEMGMNNFKEISLLTDIAKPDIAVITNIGTAHIGNLGSRENILKAKLEIVEGLKENGKLIINNDNDLLHDYYINNKSDYIVTVGINNDSDYMANNILYLENGSSFSVEENDILVNVSSSPFVYNALIAYAIGKEMNISVENIKKGIENFTLTKNRLEILTNKKGVIIINDTYNASYDSVKAALETLKNRKEKRKIAVLGDILELGKFSEDIHRSLAKEVIDSNLDILVLVGSEVKYLLDELIENDYKKEIYLVSKYDETYDLLDNVLKKDDVILLKGSHSVNLTKVVNHLMD